MKRRGLEYNTQVKAEQFVGYRGESDPPCLKLGGTFIEMGTPKEECVVLGDKGHGNCCI